MVSRSIHLPSQAVSFVSLPPLSVRLNLLRRNDQSWLWLSLLSCICNPYASSGWLFLGRYVFGGGKHCNCISISLRLLCATQGLLDDQLVYPDQYVFNIDLCETSHSSIHSLIANSRFATSFLITEHAPVTTGIFGTSMPFTLCCPHACIDCTHSLPLVMYGREGQL